MPLFVICLLYTVVLPIGRDNILCTFAVMRQFLLVVAIVCGVIAGYGARSVDDIPNVHLADARRYVSNPDGVLTSLAVARLDTILGSLWAQTSSEVVVVAVDEVDGGDVDAFATELFTRWGIGKRDNDNGLLVLISRSDRMAVLRTGYGLEGVLPDVVCGRIIRNQMAPYYKEGDYDGGTLAAVSRIADIISNPDVAAEVMSKYANDERRYEPEDFTPLWNMLFVYLIVMGCIGFLLVWANLRKSRGKSPQERYIMLNQLRTPLLVLCGVGLGAPLLSYLLMSGKLKKLRNSPRKCPNCSHPMVKLDEEKDNYYLTPAQDTEEKINSVDYDVWLCDECGERDVIPFVNSESNYNVCPLCGARACRLEAVRTVVKPTTTREGRGEKVYMCLSCNRRSVVGYMIPKVVVPPVVILPGSGSGGGSGFSGGSFGGGMTGGGGASGGW